jgi:peptidoglycan LD-endopeptidase LytH
VPLRVFPVEESGRPTFSDDWGAARGGGRTHEGTDIFAREGTPVRAVDAGRVRFDENALGGHTAYLATSDGTTYYFAHLERYEGTAREVAAGETIGYVGRTGNARSTPAHLHFQIHVPGVGNIDPFAALTAAKAGAPERGRGERPGAPKAPPDGGGGLFALVVLYFLSRRG